MEQESEEGKWGAKRLDELLSQSIKKNRKLLERLSEL